MQDCESSRREAKLLRLEKGELDHVCDFYPTYQYDSVMECSDSLLHIVYKCGACEKDFSTICALHNHVQDHVAGGSYFYDHVCRTAYPKFDTCCAYTQTELIVHETRNLQESFGSLEVGINNIDTCKAIKKSRGRPKGSKNLVKRRKLTSPVNMQIIIEEYDKLPIVSDLTGESKAEEYIVPTQCVVDSSDIQNHDEIGKGSEYNGETTIDYDDVDLKNEDLNSCKDTNDLNTSVKLKMNSSSVVHKINETVDNNDFDTVKEMNEEKVDKVKLEAESINVFDNDDIDTGFKTNEFGSNQDDNLENDQGLSLAKGPKNKRKLVQPRKVMKHNGQNKFKNKSLYKTKKNYPQPVNRLQIKEGFTLVGVEKMVITSVENDNPETDESIKETEKNHEDERKMQKSKLFKCGLCEKTMSRYLMMRHNCENNKTDIENGDGRKPKRQNCEFCGFSFTRSEYEAHVRSHTGERPFICEKCGKDFARIKYLKKHLITHQEVKPFICSLCGAGFCQNKEYKQHMCSHTGARDHVCNVCDATFICKASLLTHVQNIHLGETRFECDVCLRRFFKKSSFDLHRATHFEAALSCQFCSKKFKDSTGLKRHEKIHTGVKKFRCHLCDHAFVQSTPFWAHMEKRHGLARDEAKRVHKENTEKAKLQQHATQKQDGLDNVQQKSDPAAKSVPILQQPFYPSMITAGANLTEEFERLNKDYQEMNVNEDKNITSDYTHHILTNVNPHMSESHLNMNVNDTVVYNHTLDLSKYTTVPQTGHYENNKSDFSEYVSIDNDSNPDKTAPHVNNIPSSSQFENDSDHVHLQKLYIEGLEKVQSDLRDFSKYQYDVMKHNEQFSDLYDPINYEKVHDLSNPEQKAAKVAGNRSVDTVEKERNGSPVEPYTGYVKVPDPSLYSWTKKSGHYEKLPETSEAHAVNIAELDQYRLLEKGSEIHGLKISDLLPADKPQDLSFLGIAAYQSYITSAQGQGYFDKAYLQSQYEKVNEDYDKTAENSPYTTQTTVSQGTDSDQTELTRVQSPYEGVHDQTNVSTQ